MLSYLHNHLLIYYYVKSQGQYTSLFVIFDTL